MTKEALSKLSDDEVKEVASSYGFKTENQTRAGLELLLLGENKPKSSKSDKSKKSENLDPKPEVVEPEVVAPAKGNTQVTSELEKQLKALTKRVAELEKYDIRKIKPRISELESRKSELESELEEIDKELSELEELAA